MGLFKKFASVGGATMASRVLGFVREMLIAALLGTGPIADAFYAAFRFPNLFRRLFAEGAFNAAFVPLFAKRLEESEGSARQFANEVLSCVDVAAEITRRREIYLHLDKMILGLGGVPVFNFLPDKTSPYVFPFRVDDENIETIMKYLKKNNLDCYLWPDLPDSIVQKTNSYYRNVWMIPFVW